MLLEKNTVVFTLCLFCKHSWWAFQNAKSILCMFVKLCLIKSNQQVVQDTLKGQILKYVYIMTLPPPPGRKEKL